MAFSYRGPHHPFDLLDSGSVYLPKTPVAVETLLVPPHHAAAGDHLSTAGAASSSSCFTSTITIFPNSSSINVPRKEIDCTKKKRKIGDDQESLITGEYSKDGKDSTLTKQKRAKKKAKADDTKKASDQACSDPNGGYIHVRARRGQATDSHSLAERVRREKIGERMKMLQGLVPGCEKVTGKALMLDEIINYVQSLQNQVEFLSMRIASLSPVLYDFNVNLDDCINQHQRMLRSSNLPQALPSLDQANNYQVQGPTSFSQVDGSGLHDEQRSLGFMDQLGFISMCSFQ